MNYQDIIDRYYPESLETDAGLLREIYLRHCRSVTQYALDIARRKRLDLDLDKVEAAAMLHDIGIFMTDAPGIHCHGTEPYICHGILGAKLLRGDGVDEDVAAVAERHTGAGISASDIEQLHLPLPPGDYMPRTLLERLVCYADKFFSKSGDMKQKSLDRVRASMARHSDATLERFEQLHREFAD